ncbi:Uncharacterised protein [Mycobacterium tuberculosis]|nr:Uncharacterised protein [Mycobacterium tuberculosis]
MLDSVKAGSRDRVFVWLHQANIIIGDDVSFWSCFFPNQANIGCFDNGVVKFKTFDNNFF